MGTSRKRAAAIGMLALALVAAGIGVTNASAKRDLATSGTAMVAAPVLVGAVGADAAGADATGADVAIEAGLDAEIAAIALQALGGDPVIGGRSSSDHASGPGRRGPLMHLARGGKLDRLIHVEAILDHPDDGIITVALDHGTVSSVSGGNLAVKRADGQTATIATDDDTKVRIGRKKGDLDDVETGAEVLVQSRSTDDGWLAKRVFVIPTRSEEAGD